MTSIVFEDIYGRINILIEMKVYNLHGRNHVLDDNNNDI